MYGILQVIRKAVEPIEKAVKQAAMKEAVDAGADKEPVRYFGFEFRHKNGARRFEFKHIPAWVEIDEERKKIEKIAKTAEEMGQPMPNPDTGEMISPAHCKHNNPSLIASKV